MTSRGFLLGKFMPPHAGHMLLCESARAMVDELTILVCSLPGDPIAGALRLAWMRELLPDCRVIHHDAPVPQGPWDDPDFWPLWRDIVRAAHPEPIDLLFAGQAYGLRLAAEVDAVFVPIGARVMGQDPDGIGGLSAGAVRADPWAHWRLLPAPVRAHYARTFCLHGVESTGKSMMAERLARHFGTVWTPEYGRAHCEAHGIDLDEAGLLLIGRAQHAMIAASLPWCDRRLIVDTDALMTAAWCEMLLGGAPDALFHYPKADLYLLLEPDVPWIDDGTRCFGTDEARARFAAACRAVLDRAGVKWQSIGGSWDERLTAAAATIAAVGAPA
ncbi:MAG TPA: AAA family ATPase [Allosphingosinicella sp.]|nr:AAA family ATPase [Allosphingosinicella sp.]